MNSFWQLFKANLKMFVREKEGLYWTVLLPSLIYILVSLIPVAKFLNTGFNYSSFLLPGVIALTIMQGGIYTLAYWMVDLKARGITKRLLATPLKTWQLILSVVCARLIIIIVQVIILSLLGKLIFHVNLYYNILSILILVILGGGIFLLGGLLISNYAKSYDSAAPITSAVAVPLPFLSSVFYPLTAMPQSIQTIAKCLPMVYLADGLRQSYLYSFDLQKIGKDILILAAWLIAMLIITISVFRLKED